MARILIVDDEKSIRRTLGEFLRDAGYEVAEAEDADAALAQLRAVAFDVVVTDILLPRVSGVELLRLIQRTAPDVQVVMMTGEPTVETAAEALRLGAADYLFKPIDKAAILRAAGNAARIKDLEDTRRRLEAENQAHREHLERLVVERAAQLQASEARYRSLVETTFDWVWEVDAQGRYTYASPRVLDLLGYRPEEILGHTAFEFMPADEARRVQVLFDQTAARRDPFVLVENTNCHRDGRLVILETSGSPILSPAGQLLGYHGMDRDITQRKLAEEALQNSERALRQAQRLAKIGSWEWDIRSDLHTWSEETFRIYGRDPALPPAVYPEVQQYFTPESWSQLATAVEVALATGAAYECDAEVVRPDGGRRWVTAHGEAVRDASGTLTHLRGTVQDITERKQAEAAVRESERKYRTLFEGSRDAIMTVDPVTHKFISCNPAAVKMFGAASEADLIACEPANLSPERQPDGRLSSEAVQARDAAVMEQGVQFFEWSHHRLNGEEFAADVLLARIEWDNRPVVMATVRDITDRKQAEEALRERETRLRTLGDNLPGGAVYQRWIHPDGRNGYSYISEGIERIFGMSAERVLAEPAAFLELVVEEDRLRLATAEHQSARDQTVFDCEFRQRTVTGDVKWIRACSTPRRLADGSTIWDGVAADITDRKQAEAELLRLATAVEQAAEGVFITDIEGGILYANPAFERITGYTCQEALGQSPRILKSGKHDEAFYRHLWDTLTRGEVWQGHFINQKKDGSLYEGEATISPVRDAAGNVVHYVAVTRDVTAQVALEAQLRQAQKMEALGTLASGVAHEINNPLFGIRGYAELIADSLPPENQLRELAAGIIGQADHVGVIVRNLLTFARQDKHESRLVAPNDIIQSVLSLLRTVVRHDQITLRVDVPESLPPVACRGQQIEQVLMNLLTNARDALNEKFAGHSDGKLICISAGRIDKDGAPWLRITVEDHGAGIPAHVRERIFDPFYTTKPAGKGTGLGLSISHGIVKDHGGELHFETEPGRGTRFHVDLPVPASPRDAG